MGLMDILQNALSSNEPEKHFDQVAQNASSEHSGLIKMLGGTALLVTMAKIEEHADRG